MFETIQIPYETYLSFESGMASLGIEFTVENLQEALYDKKEFIHIKIHMDDVARVRTLLRHMTVQ